MAQLAVCFHILSNIIFNLKPFLEKAFVGRGFEERFECFAAASDEWENRGGAEHFFAPRPLHFLPRAHPMGGEGRPLPGQCHRPLSGPVLRFSSIQARQKTKLRPSRS